MLGRRLDGATGPDDHAADRIARGSPTPAGDWQKVAPASVGLDATKLDAIAKTAEVGKSNCLVVVKDGKLAGEWYFHGTGPDTAQPVFSATKSYTSTLVGMAVDEGRRGCRTRHRGGSPSGPERRRPASRCATC